MGTLPSSPSGGGAPSVVTEVAMQASRLFDVVLISTGCTPHAAGHLAARRHAPFLQVSGVNLVRPTLCAPQAELPAASDAARRQLFDVTANASGEPLSHSGGSVHVWAC